MHVTSTSDPGLGGGVDSCSSPGLSSAPCSIVVLISPHPKLHPPTLGYLGVPVPWALQLVSSGMHRGPLLLLVLSGTTFLHNCCPGPGDPCFQILCLEDREVRCCSPTVVTGRSFRVAGSPACPTPWAPLTGLFSGPWEVDFLASPPPPESPFPLPSRRKWQGHGLPSDVPCLCDPVPLLSGEAPRGSLSVSAQLQPLILFFLLFLCNVVKHTSHKPSRPALLSTSI